MKANIRKKIVSFKIEIEIKMLTNVESKINWNNQNFIWN